MEGGFFSHDAKCEIFKTLSYDIILTYCIVYSEEYRESDTDNSNSDKTESYDLDTQGVNSLEMWCPLL